MVKWKTATGGRKVLRFPTLTIIRNGRISLNRPAMELLKDDVEEILPMFDEDGNRIGIRPVKEPGPKTRKITHGHHTLGVHVKEFLDEFGIDYKQTRSYRVTKENGDLVVNLAEPL